MWFFSFFLGFNVRCKVKVIVAYFGASKANCPYKTQKIKFSQNTEYQSLTKTQNTRVRIGFLHGYFAQQGGVLQHIDYQILIRKLI